MSRRPELAVYVARVTVGWSRIEERVGFIIVQLLRAEAHTGMKMYQALTSSAAQMNVLRAVARDRLDKSMQDRLEELLSDFKKVGRRRNNVVHGHWDTSENHPDELLWTDAADDALSHSAFWSGYNAAKDFEEQIKFARAYEGPQPKRLLYSKADFEDLLEAITLIGSRLQSFYLDVEKLNRPPRNQTSVGRV